MKKPISRAAVIAGTTLLAATLLTGCGGEKHTFSGLEVSGLDKTIDALDASWSQHRANGTAANVDDNSHCFVQTGKDGVLANKALCGPVRYLGDDAASWDAVALQPSPDGSDKVTLAGGSDFVKDQPNPNTALYRTDGKTSVDGANLAEPDTKAAEPEKALWDAAANTGHANGKSVSVITPDGNVSVTVVGVTDRVGIASNRIKAGDGRKFATVMINSQIGDTSNNNSSMWGSTTPAVQPKTDIAFVTGGKTYPMGLVKNGTVSMSLPGDGKDIALAVGYADFKQTVTLADSSLHTTATAYYDGLTTTAQAPEPPSLTIGDSNKNGIYAEFSSNALTATRTAYDTKNGWAAEGKAWLILDGSASSTNPMNQGPSAEFPGGTATSSYDASLRVSSASVANISGTKFTAAAKSMANNDDGSFGGGARFKIVFEVPASATDFTVDYNVHSSGKLQPHMDAGAPSTTELDYPVKGVQFTFTKK